MLTRVSADLTLKEALVYLLLAILALASQHRVSARPVENDNLFDHLERNDGALVPAANEAVSSLADLRDGVYALILSNPRAACGGSDEYLGFNNRTCSPAVSSSLTAGPVLRQASKSDLWREWMVRVLDTSTDKDSKTVSLQAFISPDVEEEAKCLGFVSSFYGNAKYQGTCNNAPYGTQLFLNGTRDDTQGSAQAWTVRPVEGQEGVFELLASIKPNRCKRLMGVTGCSSQATLVEDPSSGADQYTTWKLVRRYDFPTTPSPASGSPSLSPSPPSPTTPSPRPSSGVPGPVISAPSSSSAGVVDVIISSLGGSEQCPVTSVVLTSKAGTIGSTPKTIEVAASRPGLSSVGIAVPLSDAGYNSVYAVGMCNGGPETTEPSNSVSVFYSSELQPPAIPVASEAGQSDTSISLVAWEVSRAVGYKVQCLPGPSEPCQTTGPAYTEAPAATINDNGTVMGTVSSLSPSGEYSCYIIAFNAAGRTCSNRVTSKTFTVYRLLGVNKLGYMYYQPNIFDATSTWQQKGNGYLTTACSLTGTNAAAIQTNNKIVTTDDVTKAIGDWVTTDASGTTVSIGDNKQGIFTDTSNPSKSVYTDDLVLATLTGTTDISAPDVNNTIVQVAISGVAVLGMSAENLYYIANVTAASPAWGTALNLPAGVTAPSLISLSGTAAVVTEGLKLYYTTDITQGVSVSWTEITMPTTSPDFGDKIYGVSLSGTQVAVTADTSKTNNIFLTNNIGAATPVWDHPGGQLNCISLGATVL